MSATEGFWPGESPAAEEQDVLEREALAEPAGWPKPHAEAAEAEPEEEAQAEPAVETEAEPETDEPEPVAEEAGVATAVHIPGDLDIPDGVAVLEGSPSGAERTVA